MNKEKKSFLSHFNIYHIKFGSKLMLVFFSLLILCLLILSIIGIRYFKNFIEESNYQRLAQIGDIKKQNLEKSFALFNNEFKKFAEDKLSYEALELKNAFNSYDTYGHEDSLGSFKNNLREFYFDEIIEKISHNQPQIEEIFPTTEKQILFQYDYIFSNPNPIGEKDKMLESEIQSDYSYAHMPLHVKVRDFKRTYNIQNLYLVDGKTGVIFYNLNKNISLGSNIYDGPYENSGLATMVHRTLAQPIPQIEIADYSSFVPNMNKSAGFIAYPILENGEKSIIAVAEIGPEFFQQFLLEDWMLIDSESLSLYLIGEDYLLRTEDIELLKDKDDFISTLFHKGKRNKQLVIAAEIQSCAMNLGFDKELDFNFNTQTKGKTYLGSNALFYSQKVKLDKLNWTLVTSANSSKSFLHLAYVRNRIILAILIMIGFSIFVIVLVKNSITTRLQALSNSILTTAKGEKVESFKSPWKDELGNTIEDFNILKNRIDNASSFAIDLSEGNYTCEFNQESEKDTFGGALNTLKEKLITAREESKKREIEDKIQKWTNDGIAKFNDLLRQSNDNINQLSYLVIENLIDYLNANQGGIFLVEGEEEEQKVIKLAASFAYDRRKFNTKTIEIGEGLLGNCYLEKKPIHLKQIPQDYIEVTSGLGQTNPSVLYIVPLMVDEKILGFIELASLEDIEDYKINFINRLADNIAATFSTVKLNTRTAELLEESKRRANEIAQQEEEMRQNMEEMQATQEELARIRDEDEKRSQEQNHELKAAYKMIQQLLNSLDGEVLLKDSQGIVVLANEEAAKRFNTTPDKLKGKSDSDLFTPEKAQREHELDQLVLKDGFYSEDSVELVGSEDVTYFVIKKQFFLPNRQESGILTIRNKRS